MAALDMMNIHGSEPATDSAESTTVSRPLLWVLVLFFLFGSIMCVGWLKGSTTSEDIEEEPVSMSAPGAGTIR